MLRRLDFGATNGRVGALFMVGSACFAVASVPALAEVVPGWAIASIYFVGSLFFTAAAALQLAASSRHRDRLAAGVQLIGTVLFNLNTGAAFLDQLDPLARDLIVWAPNAEGSIAFLIASLIGMLVAQHDVTLGIGHAAPRRAREDWPTPLERAAHALRREWREAVADLRSDEIWIAGLNLAGSIAFGVAAVASFAAPSSGDLLDASAVNSATLIGGVLFFLGAFLLVEEREPD